MDYSGVEGTAPAGRPAPGTRGVMEDVSYHRLMDVALDPDKPEG